MMSGKLLKVDILNNSDKSGLFKDACILLGSEYMYKLDRNYCINDAKLKFLFMYPIWSLTISDIVT